MKLKKLKFILVVSCYPFLKFLGIHLNMMDVINEYYNERFRRLPYKSRAIFLPHCLRASDCPAKFSSELGVLCIKCGKCKCREIKELSEKKGYKFFLVPDVTFIKRIISKYKIQGIIGVACEYDIKKGLKEEKIGKKGVKVRNIKVIPQGVKLPKKNCVKNTVDWNLLKKMINEN